MPVYSLNLTLAANGNANSLETATKRITPGILTKMIVMFPAGHVGLTFVSVFYNARQIIPNHIGEFLRGSGVSLPFEPDEDLTEAPHIITLSGYNEDDTFEHTVYFWFEIKPKRSRLDPRRFLT